MTGYKKEKNILKTKKKNISFIIYLCNIIIYIYNNKSFNVKCMGCMLKLIIISAHPSIVYQLG